MLRRWAQPAESVAYEVRLLEQIAALGWPVIRQLSPGRSSWRDISGAWRRFSRGEPPVLMGPEAVAFR